MSKCHIVPRSTFPLLSPRQGIHPSSGGVDGVGRFSFAAVDRIDHTGKNLFDAFRIRLPAADPRPDGNDS